MLRMACVYNAAGDMLQIITQTGEEAPYITVLICQ